MSRVALVALLAVTLGSLSGCAGSSSSSSSTTNAGFTDSVGVKYTLDCSGSVCVANPQDTSVVPLTCPQSTTEYDVFLLVWARVAAVAAVHLSSTGALLISDAAPAHPLVCDTDSQCPNSGNTNNNITTPFTCINHICQRASRELGTDDVIVLCQADIPWPTSCPYITSNPFASRLAAISAACPAGGNCSIVPPSCLQPTASVDAGTPPVNVDAGTPAVDAVSAIDTAVPPVTAVDAAVPPVTKLDAATPATQDAGDDGL